MADAFGRDSEEAKSWSPGVCFYGPKMHFSDGLLAAVAKELPECTVFHSRDLRHATGTEVKVALHPLDCVGDLAGFMEEIAAYCPMAHVAFIYDSEAAAHSFLVDNCETILRTRSSLVPLNVRLDVWIQFIRLFLLGQKYLPADLLMASEDAAEDRKLKSSYKIVWKLTPRELEILALAARGAQNKVIAEQLGISEHTVKLHMHHVIRKMKVRNRTEAAHLFLQTGE